MNNYYDQISEGYEELHKEEQEKKLQIVKDNIEVEPDDLLLDVGCGTGITSDFPCKVTGLDPAKLLLEKCKLDIELVQAEAENMPFDDNHFDVVVSITAIQNFHDIKKGLKEIARVGKDKFALSFLKKSEKKEVIDKYIREIFDVKDMIEEDKDLIYICNHKNSLHTDF